MGGKFCCCCCCRARRDANWLSRRDVEVVVPAMAKLVEVVAELPCAGVGPAGRGGNLIGGFGGGYGGVLLRAPLLAVFVEPVYCS